MTDLTTLAVVSGGFYAGFVVAALVTTGVRFRYGMRLSTIGEPQRPLAKRAVSAIPLLVGIPGLAYLAYSGYFAGRWAWFVGGFFLSIAYIGTLVLFAMGKAKRKRLRAPDA